MAKFKAGGILNNLPAKTGKANNNNIAVTNTLQTNKGNLCKLIPLVSYLNSCNDTYNS